MRKWRLFFIAIISFIAILGENWIKKIIPISLCILLNSNSAACYINFNDGRVEAAISNSNVTDNSSNQILTLNQDLPTKQEDDFHHKLPSQIAIPPIIRPAETNLYLQNALPQDFRISSQIPYSSGKQEILLVSPSTGAEQLYTFNVPGSSSFQLFEVEYKKVSAIDFSSLTSTDSLIVNPEQIKSVLNRFKITFANNSLSKITLSDGTTANFSAGQAVIKSPQGQTVETVQISQNEFIDNNIFVSQKRGKINKNIENNPTNKDAKLLAKTSESACQAAVSSSLNGISDNLGQWGNKLTTSNSPITKSIGWAISFGSGAIKSNISTKNPMLQEVNCRPPVQCEEQRVSGGSEIRTDLFQVAKGANRKVNLKFEFFEIPDRIELYFDGKKIFGVGPQSGQGNQTFDLPTNAEYVGVKLIGNDNVNTRWWYVISCSGSCSPQFSDKEPIASVPKDPKNGSANGGGYGPHTGVNAKKGEENNDFHSKSDGNNETWRGLNADVRASIKELLQKELEMNPQDNQEITLTNKHEKKLQEILKLGIQPGNPLGNNLVRLFMNWNDNTINLGTGVSRENSTLTGLKAPTLRHNHNSLLSQAIANSSQFKQYNVVRKNPFNEGTVIPGVMKKVQQEINQQIKAIYKNQDCPDSIILSLDNTQFPSLDYSSPDNDDFLQYNIGGIQGRALFIKDFKLNTDSRKYEIKVQFVFYDDFGVDNTDIYKQFSFSRTAAIKIVPALKKGFIGMQAQWLLQHQGTAKPFVQEIIIEQTFEGSY
ncbi:MAG: hypothetical protein HEQ13_15790 [Dolichospermum sp. DEX189]|nr:hypothetical protein [Dolichospermum sp. DEX189]